MDDFHNFRIFDIFNSFITISRFAIRYQTMETFTPIFNKSSISDSFRLGLDIFTANVRFIINKVFFWLVIHTCCFSIKAGAKTTNADFQLECIIGLPNNVFFKTHTVCLNSHRTRKWLVPTVSSWRPWTRQFMDLKFKRCTTMFDII